jgi:hypothetical protein
MIDAAPIRSVLMPEVSINGGPALAADGTLFVMRDPELHVYAPGAVTHPKVITGLNMALHSNPSFDPVRGLAVPVRVNGAAIFVVNPRQPAGEAVPVRSIAGPSTRLEDVVAVTWTPDGSLWAVDLEVDGARGVELLRFAPGADGDVAPVRVITGGATALDTIDGYAGLAVDALPDGSAVVGAMGIQPGALVFGPGQTGNVPPLRRIRPAAPGTSFAQLGVAADSRGRIYIPMGDLLGEEWGEVAVYAAGATEAAKPVLRLTGPTTGLHTVAFPSISPGDRLVLGDVTVIAGRAELVRMLEFDPLPTTPSRPQHLTARTSAGGQKVIVRWRPPASDGGAEVTGYLLRVLKRGRVVRTVDLAGGVRRYAVRVGRLPRGRLTVQVSPRNVVGAGPAATKAVRR